MPRIEELLERLGKADIVSTLDLTRGYWQVPVAEQDRKKAAFTTLLDFMSLEPCHLVSKEKELRFSEW